MVRAAALLAMLAAPAAAEECRLALILALDISSSVDPQEDALQRGGMAAALRDPDVAAAFFATPQPVALAIFEWSGRYNQEILLDWTMIDTPANLADAAQVLAGSRRSYAEFSTAMGEALTFGGQMMARAPSCAAQTIDMAGDGENNEGDGPQVAYRQSVYQRITVNGLVVANASQMETAASLTAFYRDQVLHGPGAFMVVADGFEDYQHAIRAKLIREVSPVVIGGLTAAGDRG